jgi:hypothetical protein
MAYVLEPFVTIKPSAFIIGENGSGKKEAMRQY